MIRVLIAEDSATARDALLALFASAPGLEVVAVAKDGAEAVAMTRALRPSIVVMDIEMPVLDGYEATRRIMVEAPTPILIVSASVNAQDAHASLNALRAGALGLSDKPSFVDGAEAEGGRQRFLGMVRALADVKVVRRVYPAIASREPQVRPNGVTAEIVAVAASTGGPAALAHLVGALPADFPVPLLAVQHNSLGFMPTLARWLNGLGSVRVKVAARGDPLERAVLYLAPDDHHLGLDGDRRLAFSSAEAIRGFRPSASFLFGSVAQHYGPRALGVILTGMGSDGVDGLRRLRAAGGRVIAQDEASSVVFGMPGAAIAAGVVDEVVGLGNMAGAICAAVGCAR